MEINQWKYKHNIDIRIIYNTTALDKIKENKIRKVKKEKNLVKTIATKTSRSEIKKKKQASQGKNRKVPIRRQ